MFNPTQHLTYILSYFCSKLEMYSFFLCRLTAAHTCERKAIHKLVTQIAATNNSTLFLNFLLTTLSAFSSVYHTNRYSNIKTTVHLCAQYASEQYSTSRQIQTELQIICLDLRVNRTEVPLYKQGNTPLSVATLLVWEDPQLSMLPFPLQSAQLALNNPKTSTRTSSTDVTLVTKPVHNNGPCMTKCTDTVHSTIYFWLFR